MNILKFFLLCFLWILIFFLLLASPGETMAQPASLELKNPQVSEHGLTVDIELMGLFNSEILSSLRSGMPATLNFEWALRWERIGRKDPEVSHGKVYNRIVFDVLEEEFFLFNHLGRPLGACDALAGVEQTLCKQESLRLGRVQDLKPNQQYYIEIVVTLEILGDKEVRGFENWLMGSEGNSGSTEGADISELDMESSQLTFSLSNLVLGVVKKMAGIAEPSVQGRSPVFTFHPIGK